MFWMILGSSSPRNPNLIHHLGQLLRQGAKNDRLEKGIAICASGATSMDWTTARFTRPKTNTVFLMSHQYGRKSESVPCNQVEPPPYPPNKKLMGIHVHFWTCKQIVWPKWIRYERQAGGNISKTWLAATTCYPPLSVMNPSKPETPEPPDINSINRVFEHLYL